jgi:hypothetical protein
MLLFRLAAEVARAPESATLTERLCEGTRRVLGADGASIALDDSSNNRIVLAATDATAATLESLHEVLGEGPATEALRTGLPVVVDLVADEPAWPMFTEAASRQTSARSVVALPMRPNGGVLGVLMLYLAESRLLAEPLEDAAFLADALAAAIPHDPAAAEGDEPGSWSNRAEVHRATGIVVAQLGIRVGDALAILRAHAFALDQDLSEVAHAVVTGGLVFRVGEGDQ